MSNTDPTKKTRGELVRSRRVSSYYFLKDTRPAVLFTYTVKSGKSLGSDRGKKTST